MRKPLNCTILQLKNLTPYQRNLENIIKALDNSFGLIVAPEVSLTDYDYEHLKEAVAFSDEAEEILCKRVENQILIFTRLVKRKDSYANEAVVIHRHQVIHRQAKHKLFALGNEDRYLIAGEESEIKSFDIDGIRFGILICFELRFKELWKVLEGCDVIVVPAQWGLARKRHLEILARALAVMNQCYVVVANSAREDMACSSLIASPNGGLILEDMAKEIKGELDFYILKKIRRYIQMR